MSGATCGACWFELRRRLPLAQLYVIEPRGEPVEHAARLDIFRADAETTVMTGSEAELVAALRRLAPQLSDRAAVLIHSPSLLLLRAGHQRLAELLVERRLTAAVWLVGNYITSLEMAGCSITLLRLDPELKALLLAPAVTLAWPAGVAAS